MNELLIKKDRIDSLIDLVMETIDKQERNEFMSDDKKFEAFKQEQLDENEKKYGKELRDKYNNDFIDQVNQNYKKKSKYEMKKQEELNIELNKIIKEATIEGNPTSDLANKMIEKHKEWLLFYWPTYDINHHYGLIKMYTEDDRFKAYYEKIESGAAEFMLEAMTEYIK